MRTITHLNRWRRPAINTPARRRAFSILAVFALLALIPFTAMGASAATATASTVTHPTTAHTTTPFSDGGCNITTSVNGSTVKLCFYIHGGGDYIDPMYAYWCNEGPRTVEGHAEITGNSGTFNGNTYTEGAGHCTPDAPDVCPGGCYVLPGTYEGILWQYYDGSYYNVAQQYEVVG